MKVILVESAALCYGKKEEVILPLIKSVYSFVEEL